MDSKPPSNAHARRRFWVGEGASLAERSAEEIVSAMERREIELSTPLRLDPDAEPTSVGRYVRELVWMARQDAGAPAVEVPLLQAAFEHAPFGLVIADLAGRIVRCNAAFAGLLDYRAEDLVGTPIGSLSPGSDRSEELKFGMEMLAGLRSGFQVEKVFLTRSGERVDTFTAVALMQDGSGMPTGVVGHILDIGTRKRLESMVAEQSRARAEVEERFERLFRDAPQAMVMVDSGSRILQSNRAAAQLFGYTAQEMDGLSLSNLLPDELRSGHERLVAAAVGDAEAVGRMAPTREVRAVRKDGEPLVVEVGLVPLKVDGASVTLAGVQDVTAARRARDALTMSLHEKETLLREVHHRVKNNLQIVSSLLSVQADGLPPGVMQAALLDSVGRVRSMALVHQQLYALDSLARIDLRRYVDELAPGLARAFRPETRLRTEGEGIEVSAEVAVPLGLIVNELVSNALKHAFPASAAAEARPDEPWDIRVTIRRGELGLVLHVDDHGPGFSAEVPQRSGSLGLTLIRSLVRQLRGRFVVRSDGGARVEVHVPLG